MATSVLLVEDQLAHVELIRRGMEYATPMPELLVAETLADARRILASTTPDIALVDWLLPDGRGVELVTEFAVRGLFPLVVMTSKGDEALAVEAMKAGALDYVVKSVATFTEMPRIVDRSLREWNHIHERRRAEEEARAADERYRHVVESANDAIFTATPQGMVVSLNRAFETVTGNDRNAGLGQPFVNLVHEDDRAAAIKVVEDARRGLDIPLLELRIPSRSNGCRTLEFRIQPKFRDGKVTGIYGVGRDLTERRQLEMQLRQAQKMEAIGRLAGGLAHDFNNVLTVILGCADLVLQTFDGEVEDRGLLEDIRSAGWRAQRVIDQLLAFSRRQVASTRELDLDQMVAAMEQLLLRLLGEDIRLVVRKGKDLGAVLADWGQVEQWILNLAVNARDAMPEGGTLLIETRNAEVDADEARSELAPGRYVVLSVTDTGTGIPPEILDRIFEPFFTTKSPGVGTGLGLSTVHGMVRQSGGGIVVRSEIDKGTTFEVYLPRVESPHESTQLVHELPAARGSETVLIVEDEEPVRRVAQRALEAAGYTVLLADSARAALKIADGHAGPIDVLLTDVVMPGMNGRELADRFCVLRPEATIMFMSGYAGDTVAEHGVFGESANFVRKPFTPSSLSRQVMEVLRS